MDKSKQYTSKSDHLYFSRSSQRDLATLFEVNDP